METERKNEIDGDNDASRGWNIDEHNLNFHLYEKNINLFGWVGAFLMCSG